MFYIEVKYQIPIYVLRYENMKILSRPSDTHTETESDALDPSVLKQRWAKKKRLKN